jgi:type VI secretion system protein VasG
VVRTITERCTEVDSGARNVDYILTQSVLPELSSLVLERIALDQPFAAIAMTLDTQGRFAYRFSAEARSATT